MVCSSTDDGKQRGRVAIADGPEWRRVYQRALVRYWIRHVGWGSFVLYSTCLVLFPILLSVRDPLTPITILAWLAGGSAVFGFASLLSHYHTLKRQHLGYRRPVSPGTEIEFDEAWLVLHRLSGEVSVPWHRIEALWRFDDCWTLILQTGEWRFVPLPTACLTGEVKSALLENAAANGLRIVKNPAVGLGRMYFENLGAIRKHSTEWGQPTPAENSSSSTVAPWDQPGASRRDALPHRGPFLHRLAIVARVLTPLNCVFPMVGFTLCLVLLFMARHDLAMMAAGRMDKDGWSLTTHVRNTAVWGLVLGGLFLTALAAIALAVVLRR